MRRGNLVIEMRAATICICCAGVTMSPGIYFGATLKGVTNERVVYVGRVDSKWGARHKILNAVLGLIRISIVGLHVLGPGPANPLPTYERYEHPVSVEELILLLCHNTAVLIADTMRMRQKVMLF